MDRYDVPNKIAHMARALDVLKVETCCKLDAVITALGGSVAQYNSVSMTEVTSGGGPYVVNPLTAHSITFTAVSGTLDVDIDGNTVTYPAGYSGSMDFTTTNANTFTFTSAGSAFVTYTYA